MDESIRALADPTRREILRSLREQELAAGEIAARFPITDASISHHLRVLRTAGLVTARRAGRSIIYSLNAEVFDRFMEEMMDYFGAHAGRQEAEVR